VAPGVRPPLAAPRQLAPTPLTAVTVPVAGVMPEAPQAIAADITAPPACRLRYRYARTTDRCRFPPSSWPAGQSERLAITFGVNLGLRAVRPALADSRQPRPYLFYDRVILWPPSVVFFI